jgi:dTDP-4-amino-4,6-dideoxygalactose transaminase
MIKQLVACEIGPNYQVDDGFLALKLLVFYPFIRFFAKGESYKQLFTQLVSDNGYIGYVDSGRTGLTLLLKSLQLESDCEVLIQGFSCIVVPNSVRNANLIPVICDVNEDDYNIALVDAEKKITPKTRVLIVQYPFGMVPNVDKILVFCKKYNLILIEDCAHVFNQNVLIDGETKKIGMLGYGSIYSFGRDKVVSSTLGGAFLLNSTDPDTLTAIKNEYEKLPIMNLFKELQGLWYCVLTVFIIRPFYFYGFGKLVLVLARKLHMIGEIYTNKEKQGFADLGNQSKYSPVLAILLNNQLKKADKTKEHRQKISRIYNSILGNQTQDQDNLIRYPIRVPSEKYYQIKSTLKKNHVLMGTWYNSVFIPSETDLVYLNYHHGQLPVCEKLIKNQLINLPTNLNITTSKAGEIAQLIKPILTLT